MIPYIQPVLYCDPQAERPKCFCLRCGGECYRPGLLCTDCEEKL